MAYRSITVDERVYEFSTGKSHTKVRLKDRTWSAAFLNSEWGTPVGRNSNLPWTYRVAPSEVRGMILGKKSFESYPCPSHPDEMIHGLTVNPFSAEIRDKRHLMRNCRQCVEDVAMDI